MQSPSLRVSLCLGVSVTAAGLALWSWRRRSEDLRWEEVGRVEELMVYPIKSGGGYKVESGQATSYGLVVDNVVDRSFVVMQTTGDPPSHVSSGMAPMLCTLVPTLHRGLLTITPLQGQPFDVDIDRVVTGQVKEFILKGDPVRGFDCGDAVADWLCDQLYGDSKTGNKPKIRLMYVGNAEELKRPATKPPYFHFPQYKDGDMQVFHDKCAFLLTATSSLADLNSRLSQPTEMLQLRPNIVISGRPAFEEDDWAYVRIGEKVQLRTLKPRDACIRINVIPTSGKRQNEVLDTLKKYRIKPMPEELAKHWNSKPFFGIHMALDVSGEIKVGDRVYAVKKKPHWFL